MGVTYIARGQTSLLNVCSKKISRRNSLVQYFNAGFVYTRSIDAFSRFRFSMAVSQASSDPFVMPGEELRRQPRKPPIKYLVPLIYAPTLPLIKITLKRQPVLRDRLFFLVLGGAFLHGAYLVSNLYDVESK